MGDRNIESKDGVVCRGFLLDGKILYLQTEITFKLSVYIGAEKPQWKWPIAYIFFREIKLVRNKYQEDLTDD